MPANRPRRFLKRHILIGVGNPDRGDDGLGRQVAHALAGTLSREIGIVQSGGELTQVLSQLQGADAAILVDASCSGVAAGTVRRFDVVAKPLPRELFAVSTHGVGVADAIELARVLGDLPAVCIVYAIEAQQFDAGAPLSAPVAAALPQVVERVRAEFEQLRTSRARCHA